MLQVAQHKGIARKGCDTVTPDWMQRRNPPVVTTLLFVMLLMFPACSMNGNQYTIVSSRNAVIEPEHPYDREIPERYQKQLQEAQRRNPRDCPYILLHLATQYVLSGDEQRARHYFQRSLEVFQQQENWWGQGTTWNRMAAFGYLAGQEGNRLPLLWMKEKHWQEPPLSAFLLCAEGFGLLRNGNFLEAQERFRQSLRENDPQPSDPDLLLLRRDAEMALGTAMILGEYAHCFSEKFLPMEEPQRPWHPVEGAHAEGAVHLHRSMKLTREILRNKRYSPLPEIHSQIWTGKPDDGGSHLAINNTIWKVVEYKFDFYYGYHDGNFYLRYHDDDWWQWNKRFPFPSGISGFRAIHPLHAIWGFAYGEEKDMDHLQTFFFTHDRCTAVTHCYRFIKDGSSGKPGEVMSYTLNLFYISGNWDGKSPPPQEWDGVHDPKAFDPGYCRGSFPGYPNGRDRYSR